MKLEQLVEVVQDKAENVVAERGLNSNDLVIFAEPNSSLRKFWRHVAQHYSSSLILAGNLNPDLKTSYQFLTLEQAKPKLIEFAERYLIPKGFDVEIATSRFDAAQAVYFAEKAQ